MKDRDAVQDDVEADLLCLNDMPDTANTLSVAIQRASRLLRADLHKLLMAHGDLGLADFRLLGQLSRVEVATQKDLAQAIPMEQAQVSRSLSSLEKRGLVQSCVFPNDRRVRLFSMLPKGRAAYDAVRPRVKAHNEFLTADLTDLQIAESLQVLQDVVRRSANSAAKKV
ncbi:MAG: MarR family winged helix-turn-helix transcriptional regulator [Paracoccaceae bacterium]